MIKFSNCCGCVPLRTGCLILGYYHLIESIYLTVDTIITLVETSNTQVDESAVAGLIAKDVIALILLTVLLTFSLLLVIGIHKDRRSYVKAFLIFFLILIAFGTIMFNVRCATLIAYVGTTYIIIKVVIIGMITLMLNVYFLLVIRSYWITMGDN